MKCHSRKQRSVRRSLEETLPPKNILVHLLTVQSKNIGQTFSSINSSVALILFNAAFILSLGSSLRDSAQLVAQPPSFLYLLLVIMGRQDLGKCTLQHNKWMVWSIRRADSQIMNLLSSFVVVGKAANNHFLSRILQYTC